MKEGRHVSQQSAGYHRLRESMWMSLAGTLLSVLSSTMLYGNAFYCFLYAEPGHPAQANPYLHINVFGVNMDSICNDVGVLLVCGVLKNVMNFKGISAVFGRHHRYVSSTAGQAVAKVEPAPVFDSRAYDE